MIAGPDLSPALDALTERERILVEAKLKGLSTATAAAMMGISRTDAARLLQMPTVVEALKIGKSICDEHTAITRERLSTMLLDAYQSSENATEMVLAVRELAKLHGLNAPTKVEIDHTVKLKAVKTAAELRQLSLEELERIALLRPNDVLEGEFTPVARLPEPVGD